MEKVKNIKNEKLEPENKLLVSILIKIKLKFVINVNKFFVLFYRVQVLLLVLLIK